MATTRDTTLAPATVDSLENPSLDVTRWNYDPASGLLTQKLYDDGKGPSYTYTPDGKLSTRTWARGVVTEYDYDALGQLAGIDYSDNTPDVIYTYDRLNRQLSAIATGVSTNLYVYSTNTLELVSEIQNGVVIDRSRDAFGRESGIALEADYDVSSAYDGYGRFASVAHAQSTNTFEYSYLPGASLVSGMTSSTGHAWTRSYEPQRHLITAVTNSFNGNFIFAFDYANDEIGRRTARLDSQPAGVAITNVFGYNVRSEVTTAAMGTNAYGYVFDPIGNRIVSTNNAEVTSYAANELNQYTNILCVSATPREPTHDDDGNMTFLPSTAGGGAGGEGWYFQWDGENRLIGVSSNNVLLATHTYDHQSRRVGKFSHEDAKTRSYVYDGWNLIQELTHSQTHTLTNSYTWGLDLSGSLQGAGGVGGLLAVVQDSATYVPAWDANGNVTEYSSTDGAIAAHYEYDAFGETIVQTGAMADAFSFRFSTKYWEDEAKLYYYGYRFYEPNIGRWLNRDPIGELGGGCLYVFVGNGSVNGSDIIGLAKWEDVQKLLNAVLDAENRCNDCCPKTKDYLQCMEEGIIGNNKKLVEALDKLASGIGNVQKGAKRIQTATDVLNFLQDAFDKNIFDPDKVKDISKILERSGNILGDVSKAANLGASISRGDALDLLLVIGAEFGPKGVDSLFGYYSEAYRAAMSGIADLPYKGNHEQKITNGAAFCEMDPADCDSAELSMKSGYGDPWGCYRKLK